jgi:ATP-binding cassette subfamily B protein AbcA/BmrA
MLLITHNIPSLINVDYIYFIEHGVITGHGSYLDLKRENKSFKKLCDQQDI